MIRKTMIWTVTSMCLVSISSVGQAGFDAAAYVDHESRVSHARELLGKQYKRSVVRQGELVTNIDVFVKEKTLELLPERFKKHASALAKVILEESSDREFDPVFLMSVIRTESNFNPSAVGGVGEIGLMQLRPQTAKWIAKLSGIAYRDKKQLFDPVYNVRLGAAYFSMLREKFNSRGGLYMAAYNMGAANVKKALRADVTPVEYSSRIMGKYVKFYQELAAVKRTKKRMWAMR